MSYLCYSLDEAAKQLGMSETVLFRLSQFLKIPASAYDDVGYIAFNGDLSFNDSDLSFFKQVKERLLKGETLETIKQRMKGASSSVTAPAYQATEMGEQSSAIATIEPPTAPLNTIETVSHLKKEAAKTFNRYKVQARPRLNQVFQNLAQQITDNLKQNMLNTTSKPVTPAASILKNMPTEPLWHPETIHPAARQGQNNPANPSSPVQQAPIVKEPIARPEIPAQGNPYPWQIQPETKTEPNLTNASVETSTQATAEVDFDSPWVDIIQAASQSPRSLNVRLRAAAQTLRQKALYQIQQANTADS